MTELCEQGSYSKSEIFGSEKKFRFPFSFFNEAAILDARSLRDIAAWPDNAAGIFSLPYLHNTEARMSSNNHFPGPPLPPYLPPWAKVWIPLADREANFQALSVRKGIPLKIGIEI